MRQRRLLAKATAAAVVLVAFAILYFCLTDKCVLLTDSDTGARLGAFPVRNNGEFSVTFIHSVNQSPVTDIYQVRGHAIYVVRTVYFAFGAGVQSEIQSGQTLTYGDDGSMIVSGFDQRIETLSYIVGTVSDHVLEIDGLSIGLRDLCGQNTAVRFSVGRKLFVD